MQMLNEIPLNKTRTDATFPLKAIGNKKVSVKTKLYNLNKIINSSDTSYIDYTNGGCNLTTANDIDMETLFNEETEVDELNVPIAANGLEPLNTLFSDNIVVYVPIPDKKIADIATIRERFKQTDNILDDNEDDNDINNKQLLKIAKELLPTTTANIKCTFNTLNIDIKKKDIKPIGTKDIRTYVLHPSTYAQALKIDLSKIDPEQVFALINNIDAIQYLHKNNIYIHDIDFTRDYKGVFNKKQVIKHLVDNHGFVEQEDVHGDVDDPVIINNNHYVSNNCLTFIRDTSIGRIRYKFYNKFVQAMESPSVRKNIGSHIADWINNPEPRLKEAINNSLDTGILRLEFTIYRYDQKETTFTKDDVEAQMQYLHNLMPAELIYYNSIENQFNLLCRHVLYNVCIVDLDSDTAFIALYHNKLTGKVNGAYLEKANSVKLSNALRYFCSNKPIAVVLMQIDNVNDEINIQQDCYLRISKNREPLYTYLATGSENIKFARSNKDTLFNEPQDMGLVANDTFNFKYCTNGINLTKSGTNAPIAFKPFKLELLQYPDANNTIRSLNKSLKEEHNEDTFNRTYAAKLQEIKEQNDKIEQQTAKVMYKEMVRNKLYKILSNQQAFTRKFIDLLDNTTVYVYAIKQTNTRYGSTYLLAGSLQDAISDNTELNLYWSPTNVTHYIDKVIANNGFKQLDINKISAYGSLSGKPRLTLIKTGTFTSASKNKVAKVEIKQTETNRGEDVRNVVKADILVEMDGSVNVKQCKKLDDCCDEGDVVKVLGYRMLKASVVVKASINEAAPVNMLCSYWLKEILQDRLKKNNTATFKAIAGVYKTTPQKKKARLFKCNC